MFSLAGRHIQTPLQTDQVDALAATVPLVITPTYELWLNIWHTDTNKKNEQIEKE